MGNLEWEGDELYLPHKDEKISKAVARRVRTFAEKVRFPGTKTDYELAKRIGEDLGIPGGLAYYILIGTVVPPPLVAARIVKWMYEGVTYEGKMLADEAVIREDKRRFRVVKATLRKAKALAATRKAEALGLTLSAFIDLAVTRLLENEPVMSTLQEAADKVEAARLTQLFRENPDLKPLLSGHLTVAKKVWDSGEKATNEPPTDVEKIIEFDDLNEWEDMV